jgi:hypothetical protein
VTSEIFNVDEVAPVYLPILSSLIHPEPAFSYHSNIEDAGLVETLKLAPPPSHPATFEGPVIVKPHDAPP